MILKGYKVTFLGYECVIDMLEYGNGRIALRLIAIDDLSPVATASVNVVSADLADDEICIKNYSENEGMLEALIEAKVVSEPIRYVKSGYVEIPVCHLLIKL